MLFFLVILKLEDYRDKINTEILHLHPRFILFTSRLHKFIFLFSDPKDDLIWVLWQNILIFVTNYRNRLKPSFPGSKAHWDVVAWTQLISYILFSRGHFKTTSLLVSPSQPDLLNLKKGWMVKLDGSEQVELYRTCWLWMWLLLHVDCWCCFPSVEEVLVRSVSWQSEVLQGLDRRGGVFVFCMKSK